jgi:hypothetical protein
MCAKLLDVMPKSGRMNTVFAINAGKRTILKWVRKRVKTTIG